MKKRNNLFPLLKAQCLGFFGINKMLHSKKKGSKIKLIAMALGVVLICVLTLILLCETYIIQIRLIYYGDNIKIFVPSVIETATSICFLLATVSVIGVLFGVKDYETLMSLPVKVWQIVLAKIFYLYLNGLLISLFFITPAMFYAGSYMGAGAEFYISTLIVSFTVPILPLTLAVFIGACVALITARLKHKSVFQSILICGFIIAFFAVWNVLTENSQFLTDCSVILNNIWYALLVLVATTAAFVLPCLFTAKFYQKINVMLLSCKTQKNFQLKAVKSRSAFGTLFLKELKRLFGCLLYMFNSLFGVIMMIILTVTMSAIFWNVLPLISEYGATIASVMLVIMGFLSTGVPTTASSISVEGKNIWVLKSAPILPHTVLYAKLAVNSVINVPISVAIAVFGSIVLSLPIGTAILFVFSAALIALFGGISGLLINLRLPMLDWENIAMPIKRGASTAITSLVNIAIMLAFGGLTALLMKVHPVLPIWAMAVISLALNCGGLLLLNIKGAKMFLVTE